jgi:hypothetical protein
VERNREDLFFLSFRCAYPIQGFSKQEDAGLFHRVCEEHSHVIPEQNATVLSTSPQQADRVSIESDSGSLGTNLMAKE